MDNLADELETFIPNLLLEQELTALALVQNRVQETGKDSKGGKLGDYSTRKLPAFFFVGKGKKTTDAKLMKLGREGKRISYKEFRELDGKQAKFVDVTFTGQNWRQQGLVKQQISKDRAAIVIGPTTKRAEEVSENLDKKYGNWLALSEEELQEIADNMAEAVEEVINKHINGL